MLQGTLNRAIDEDGEERFSPRRLDDNENARQEYSKLQDEYNDKFSTLRELQRQVPTTAIDYENELNLIAG